MDSDTFKDARDDMDDDGEDLIDMNETSEEEKSDLENDCDNMPFHESLTHESTFTEETEEILDKERSEWFKERKILEESIKEKSEKINAFEKALSFKTTELTSLRERLSHDNGADNGEDVTFLRTFINELRDSITSLMRKHNCDESCGLQSEWPNIESSTKLIDYRDTFEVIKTLLIDLYTKKVKEIEGMKGQIIEMVSDNYKLRIEMKKNETIIKEQKSIIEELEANREKMSNLNTEIDVLSEKYRRSDSLNTELSKLLVQENETGNSRRLLLNHETDKTKDSMAFKDDSSLSARSTPDLALSAFNVVSNGNAFGGHTVAPPGLRSLTPLSGMRQNDLTGQSHMIPLTHDKMDLNGFDLISHFNLAQLSYFDDASSMTTSTGNTPSPTPINPNVPLEDGALVLNDTAINNLSQLCKLSAIEVNVHNGLVPVSSATPLSVTPTSSIGSIGRCGSAGSKPNVMQIRCKFGQLGQAKGQFSSPHGFCLGVDEEIVIADTNNHRICIFDKNGEFKHAFGVPGKDEAQLWYPRKVAIIRTSGHGIAASPRYVICDRGSERSRMQIFTRSGHFVRKIAIRYIDIVAGLAINPRGNIVAVDSVSPTVFVIAESGDLLRWFDCSEYMREPSDIAICNNEYFICDFKGHCVVVFDDEGKYMRKIGCEGITSFPNGIDISDAGDILIGDSHGNRFHVVVFDRSGSLISEFECPYVKVSRCCGLKITSEGYVVTLAKNNHHVLILNTLYIM